MIDKLIKIVPISSAFLIFCGAFKLVSFYSIFNIDILDYINITEIITLFLDDINVLLIFFILLVFQSLPVFEILRKITQDSFEEFLDKIIEFTYLHRFKYFILFSIITFSILSCLYFDIINISYPLIYLILFLLIQISYYLLLSKNKEGEIELSINAFGFAIIPVLLFIIFLFAENDAKNIEDKYLISFIQTDKEYYECSKYSEYIYLGKTNSHVFIRNKNNDLNIIIPSSSIKKYYFR